MTPATDTPLRVLSGRSPDRPDISLIGYPIRILSGRSDFDPLPLNTLGRGHG